MRDIVKLVCCKERGNSLMAKVINLFESRNQEKKNDWRKTLTGIDKEQLNDGEVLDKKT